MRRKFHFTTAWPGGSRPRQRRSVEPGAPPAGRSAPVRPDMRMTKINGTESKRSTRYMRMHATEYARARLDVSSVRATMTVRMKVSGGPRPKQAP